MTDAGTLVLTTAKHLAADHGTQRTIPITTLAHKQLHNTFMSFMQQQTTAFK